MKVLIIGGAGFVGSNLVRYCLAEKSCQITVMDSLDPLLRSTTDNLQDVRSQIRFVHGDMRDDFLLAEIIQDQEFLIPAPDHASYIVNRMKEKGILISTDGPDHNVLKIKPPMVFTKENAIHLVTTLEEILCESILRI